ncbi:MAG: hypothetical protein ACOY3I_09270 [Verrucomicrobiota bacterium]
MPAFFLNSHFWGNAPNPFLVADWYHGIKVGSMEAAIAICLAYGLILLGYFSFVPRKIEDRFHPIREGEGGVFIVVMMVCLAIACGVVYVYANQYGGIFEAIALANYIRAGVVEPGIFSFVKHFLDIGALGLYLIVAYLLFQKNFSFKTLWLVGILLLFVAFVVLAALLKASRASCITVGLIIFVIYSVHRRAKAVKFLFFLIPLGVAVLLFGDWVFGRLHDLTVSWNYFIAGLKQGYSFSESPLLALLINFQYAYVSLEVYLTEVASSLHEWRWMVDWVYGFLSLIPERIFPLNVPPTVVALNTKNVASFFPAAIPPGILASSFYSMDWLGLILCSLFYGWLGGVLHRIFVPHVLYAYWTSVVYVLIGVIWAWFVNYGDPGYFFQFNFLKFIFLGFWLVYGFRFYLKRD